MLFKRLLMSSVSNMKRNIPLVESIRLPNLIMTNFILMPRTTLRNCSIENCKFIWYRRITSKERKKNPKYVDANLELYKGFYWLKLSDKINYLPTEDDVSHHLKVSCFPIEGSTIGTEVFFVGKQPVELGPTNCPFEKRHELTKNYTTDAHEFRVMSYNILADTYADSDYSRSVLFGYCPGHFLDIEYRRQLLMKEILGYHADLICLQEVDKKEYLKSLEPFMNLIGKHLGVYNTKGGDTREGLATFYRKDKFDLCETHRTVLSELIDVINTGGIDDDGDQEKKNPTNHPILSKLVANECLTKFDNIRAVILSNPNLKTRFTQRHTVLQTTLLKVKEFKNRYIIVANTHLYFAPDADHVRLLQGIVCVQYLEFIKKYYSDTLAESQGIEPELTIIFCGDMNSTPDCGLYKLLTTGYIGPDMPDWSSNKDEAVEGLNIKADIRFRSAYQNIPYTNYTRDFNGCLDYIYYECEGFDCESIIPLPKHEDVTATGGIPSDVFPSDHLALIANLRHKFK